MKCIDAVEGLIISVLKEFFSEYCPSRDDSEYTLNVKIILKAADKFVREHKEIIGDPEILTKILKRGNNVRTFLNFVKNQQCTMSITEFT